MRPDVALAFDRMDRAARADGVALVINSGFRSDAEQAELWRRHPDPRWVAPPGTSLHRNGTELDLGPPAAYGWLAAHAERFHFVQRYSWEAWHYGYTLNPGSRLGGAGSAVAGGAAGGDSGRASAMPGGRGRGGGGRRRAPLVDARLRAGPLRADDRARRAALERLCGADRRAA